VLFSSFAGIAGSPGQGSYASANAFLDALASYRVGRGLIGSALAWGLWAPGSAMTGDRPGETGRLARTGLLPLPADLGLALLDRGLAAGVPVLAPVRIDLPALRARARAGALPALFGDLVRPQDRRAAGGDAADLVRRLAGLAQPREQDEVLRDLLRSTVASVLGHGTATGVELDRTFAELGFDSLTALELRNRLGSGTGLRLPATLVFDYPTPAALAGFLRAELVSAAPAAGVDLDGLEAVLATVPAGDPRRHAITLRLRAMLARWDDDPGRAAGADVTEQIQAATAVEIFDFIDNELGRALR
jgi:acyl carrier protein